MPRIDQRQFGVEIECHVPGGIHGNRAELINDRTQWNVRSDGSLERLGIEVVSPPLKGQTGFNDLSKTLRILKAQKATVYSDCGLHVHHDAEDLSKDDIIRLCFSWSANQELISSFLKENRQSNGWASPLSQTELNRISKGEFRSCRYSTVNLCALQDHGTIEIRQHHGSLDFQEIKSWVKFGQSLIRSCKKRKRALKQTPYLLDRIAVPSKDKKYLMEKAAMLAEMRA